MSKTIVCRCEDVTLRDIERAIDDGYRDIESIKRYLALGTGPCQGKGCLNELASLLLETTGVDPADLAPITPRPPINPVPLRFFAGDAEGDH